MENLLGWCIGAVSALIGLVIGKRFADNYWINCANTGFRASVRGKLYTVEKTGEM